SLDHPDLTQALFSKIAWSVDCSMALHWHPNWHRGPWAGARIDIASLSDIEGIEEWKDVTEETFRDVWKVTLQAERLIEEDCKCKLCGIYNQMRIDDEYKGARKGDQDIKNTQRAQFSKWDEPHCTEKQEKELINLVRSQETCTIIDKLPSNHLCKSLSLFERLPYEITDLIFFHVPRNSLPACAIASTRMNSAVLVSLYATVNLDLPHLTHRFAETLIRRPFLCHYVRDLTIAVSPHWKSVRVLHDILIQLPCLVSLHTLPSWITYGDLPYWEYPFKLQNIKWGLIKDKASQKFIMSHSDTLKEINYMKLNQDFL
ncbi:11884_t:CDS:1, partial [Acaulospora colombiana]